MAHIEDECVNMCSATCMMFEAQWERSLVDISNIIPWNIVDELN